MRSLTLSGTDIGKGSLILVSRDYPVRCEPGAEQLVPVRSDAPHIRLERQAAKLLDRVTALVGCGHQIVPVSGYRSLEEQRRIYSASLWDHGEEFTKNYVALPGCSEHQTGLAIDLAENQPDIDFIRPHLPYTGIFGTFREAALRYGFIERYPAGCLHITGIAHEPWHFRYVGYPHAVIMRDQGLTLEEYTLYLQQFRWGGFHLRVRCHDRDFEIFHVPVPCDGVVQVEIPDNVPYQVSGNNVDGCIVTLWVGARCSTP